MALRIAKEWHQNPGWFYGLKRKTQIDLIAEYRLTHGMIDTKKDNLTKQERMKRAMKQYAKRDQING